jgi:hypothetical protein
MKFNLFLISDLARFARGLVPRVAHAPSRLPGGARTSDAVHVSRLAGVEAIES